LCRKRPFHGHDPAAVRVKDVLKTSKHSEEDRMKLCSALFARLGLFSPKTETAPDPFEQRLNRIGSRERGFATHRQPGLFRNQPSLQEA
jgi:hypothetical protein